MPRGGDSTDRGYSSATDVISYAAFGVRDQTTNTIDIAYDDNRDNWLEDDVEVDYTAANFSGEDSSSAPFKPSEGLGNGDGDGESDSRNNNLSVELWQQQQRHQRLTSLAHAHESTDTDVGVLATWASSHRPSYLQSTPTLPEITLDPPLSQLGCQHGADRPQTESYVQGTTTSAQPSHLTAKVEPFRQQEATPGPQSRHEGDERQVFTPAQPFATPSTHPTRRRGRPRKETGLDSNHGMARPGTSQPDYDAQKEAHSQNKPGSYASSSQSVQSRSSLDVNKSDRLGESPNAPSILRLGQSSASLYGQPSLPDEKGFSIQIGAELFKLSGASIMSDAPSYFSAFFIEQLEQSDDPTGGGVRTLFIDRDPDTFRDIARHLQGYLITPTDGAHFVKLFADAQFYRLPRLQSQLFESEILVEVGNEHFRIPRDIFSSPGDTPNYFTLGFTVFFSSPGDVFPGLNPRGLLRPPAIHPPRIPNRSPKIFADILHLLRGYPLTIRNSDHRTQLLRDARYYNLRGLEQKLISHSISHNVDRRVSEIFIRLQDIRPSQVSLTYNPTSVQSPSSSSSLQLSPMDPTSPAYITYARPYIDETPYHLIVEVPSSSSAETLSLDLHTMRVTFFGTTKARITGLFQTVANKLNLPTTMPLGLMMKDESARVSSPGNTPLSDDDVKVRIDGDCHIVLDGKDYDWHAVGKENENAPGREIVAADQDVFPAAGTTNEWPFDIPPPPPSSFSPPPLPHQIIPADNTTKRPHSPYSSSHPHHPNKRHKPTLNPSSADLPKPFPHPQHHIWTIHRAQWRLHVRPRTSSSSSSANYPEAEVEAEEREEEGAREREDVEEAPGMEIVMEAVKIEASSGEKARNAQRGFLE